jgi:copper homeostasis protein (lipoprotein)
MKNLFLTAILFLSFMTYSCQQKTKPIKNNFQQNQADNSHTSKNSLDWQGIYKGVIPCADCEGIMTTLEITSEGFYKLSTKYLGKSYESNEQIGNFSWNKEGNTIVLGGIKNGPAKYFVGENSLIQLDMEGEKITGNLAEKYILSKQSPNFPDIKTLDGPKWVLTEIMGKTIEPEDGRGPVAFILFNAEEMRVFGNGGCNSFNGAYELQDGYRIKFSKIASTLMACPDMSIEQQLFKLLETADNYTIADGVLSINKARMAPLARFTATEKTE